MAAASDRQAAFLLKLILALFDDLARANPERLRVLAGRMRQMADEEEDDADREIADRAATLIEGMVTTYDPG